MAKRSPHRSRIRRGDLVMVVAGADKGVQGRVLRLLFDDDQVVVEGVNLVYRHVRRSQQNPQGGRVRREAPVHISNVMVVDPEQNVPTRVGRKVGDEGRLTRFARKSGAILTTDSGAKKGRKGRKSKE
ncbi:MAG: 50S ribosomal protein L24 [Planctomycetota bacterium]